MIEKGVFIPKKAEKKACVFNFTQNAGTRGPLPALKPPKAAS